METIAELSLAMVSARFLASLIVGCALVIDASRQGRDIDVSIGVVHGLRFSSRSQKSDIGTSPGSDPDMKELSKRSAKRRFKILSWRVDGRD